ncbi:hypothetical protein F5Y19DRAFT_489703 [Xylariaceae sp. FL1651]|nr:hypothetical protein F5Y19DRAFT_489703 [Xylariaceae sp. FL1651]
MADYRTLAISINLLVTMRLLLPMDYVAAATATCYWPDGTEATGLVPCSQLQVGGDAPCCWVKETLLFRISSDGDFCTSDSYCITAYYRYFYRGACTRRGWAGAEKPVAACPQTQCLETADFRGTSVAVVACNDTASACGEIDDAARTCTEGPVFVMGRPGPGLAFYELTDGAGEGDGTTTTMSAGAPSSTSVSNSASSSSISSGSSSSITSSSPASASSDPHKDGDGTTRTADKDDNHTVVIGLAAGLGICALVAVALGLLLLRALQQLREKRREMHEQQPQDQPKNTRYPPTEYSGTAWRSGISEAPHSASRAGQGGVADYVDPSELSALEPVGEIDGKEMKTREPGLYNT